MNKKIFIITHTAIDEDAAEVAVVGAYASLEAAVEQMREAIYGEFEENKAWWEEDEEGDEYVEDQYQEWIDEQWVDDEQAVWSYTNDDPVEHTFRMHTAEVDEAHEGELYAVLSTLVDGCDNETKLVGLYTTPESALEAQESADDESLDEEDECYCEHVASVVKVSVE